MTILNEFEQVAMDAVNAALGAVFEIDGKRLKAAQRTEMAQAVHVLQGAVIQHALHRLDPDNFSEWYE